MDSPRQSIVYNRYAALIFTNPVFLGFSRYANVNFGSQRDKILYILGHISVRFITPQDFGSGVFFCANCDKIYITIVGILIRIPQD